MAKMSRASSRLILADTRLQSAELWRRVKLLPPEMLDEEHDDGPAGESAEAHRLSMRDSNKPRWTTEYHLWTQA